MNKELFFLIISISIFAFSIITTCTAPIINQIYSDFSRWGKINCKWYADTEKDKNLNQNNIFTIQNMERLKNLCYRQKVMYYFEYLSLVIDIILGFIISQFGLLLYFKKGNNIVKISGILGIITGIICLLLTLIYIGFSAYIFANDTAYKALDTTRQDGLSESSNTINKLFPNGAKYKVDFEITLGTSPGDPNRYSNIKKRTAYEGDNSEDADLIKYKDLGERQYNYNKRIYENVDCTGENRLEYDDNTKKCEYIYEATEIKKTFENKYLYDNWLTTLIFGCLISLLNIALIINGGLLIGNKDESDLLIKNEPDLLTKNEPKLLVQNDDSEKNEDKLLINKNNRIKNKK